MPGIVSAHGNGWSSPTTLGLRPHRSGKLPVNGYWTGFIEQCVHPDLDWGCELVLYHNAGGDIRPEDKGLYQFDQMVRARKLRPELYRDFVKAWRSLTRQGVRVVHYLGTLHADKDFDRHAGRPERGDDYLRRWYDSLNELLDAGVEIGFDYSCDAAYDSPFFAGLHFLRSLGVKVWIEPRPHADCPHLFGFGVIANDNLWERTDPRIYSDAAGCAGDGQIKGEVIRWPQTPPAGAAFGQTGWMLDAARKVLAHGHHCALAVEHFRNAGVKHSEVAP